MLLAPASDNPVVRATRDADLYLLCQKKEEAERDLFASLSQSDLAPKQAFITPSSLQKTLPVDAVFVDFLTFSRSEPVLQHDTAIHCMNRKIIKIFTQYLRNGSDSDWIRSDWIVRAQVLRPTT
jgi:hypothetical protein